MQKSLRILALALAAACSSREPGPESGREPRLAVAGEPESRSESGWRGPRADDWLSWRGPEQVARAQASGLPEDLDPERPLWSVPISGRGTPVIADGRVYAMGYIGEGATVRELAVCLDERDGRVLWEKRFRDLVTDTVYSRYGIGSPSVDAETGNVYFQTSAGLLFGCTRDGEVLWEHSLIEEYGKLTFPNGRTGAPLVDEGRVIVHIISVTWGPLAPARDRFYAFDKLTGECLWVATPGDVPIDNSFSMPYVEERGGRRVLYAETGCGYVACIDTRTGDVLWRFRMATGAANASVVVQGDILVAVHGGENLDSSTQGRMVALRIPEAPSAGPNGPVDLDASAELWRADLEAFSSSPVLGEGRVYLTDEDGALAAVDVESGRLLWRHKLAADQVHASPLFADGKLYAPMNSGSLFVLRPTDEGPGVLDEVPLAGNCLGQPAVAHGRIYVHTTGALYCFGGGASSSARPAEATAAAQEKPAGAPARLQVVPADATIRAGESVPFRVLALDAAGRMVHVVEHGSAEFERPDTLTFEWGPPGVLRLARPTAGILKVKADGLEGSARLRAVPTLPFAEDFERVVLDQDKGGEKTGRAPGGWFGAVAKWDVREKDGSKVLARVIDNPLFQRTISLLGHPDDHDYTMRLDVCSEGTRRSMSSVGVVHQRYLIELKGNHQELEVSSNVEALKVSTPYAWKPGTWYTLFTRVERGSDGAGLVRVKVWPRGEAEPAAWTLEVPHADGHASGAAGIYGFAPQSRHKVYLDNLSIEPIR